MLRRSAGFPRELLSSDETILLELKPSAVPFVIAPILALSTLISVFLIGFVILSAASPAAAVRTCGLPLVILSFILVLGGYLGYLTWWNTFYAVTDKRILQKSGLIGINAYDAPLTAIQNVTLTQSAVAKLFGLGTLVFATSGTGGGAAVQRAQVTRGIASAMWLAGNIVFAGVRDPVAARKRVQDIVERAVSQQKDREYRRMAETFQEVGATPIATIPPHRPARPLQVGAAIHRRPAKFCEFCGSRIEGAPTFCSKCGGRVN